MLGVMMWDWLSGTLVSFGILQLAVVWFGLTNGHAWAYWCLVVADLSVGPFWALIIARYVRAGARLRLIEIPPLIWVPTATIPAAVVLGWIGIQG